MGRRKEIKIVCKDERKLKTSNYIEWNQRRLRGTTKKGL